MSVTLHRLQNKAQPLLCLYRGLQGLGDPTAGENSLSRAVGDRDGARAHLGRARVFHIVFSETNTNKPAMTNMNILEVHLAITDFITMRIPAGTMWTFEDYRLVDSH